MKRLFIASTSTIYNSGYLEYILPELKLFFKGVETIIFVPYARPSGISYAAYTKIVKKVFLTLEIEIVGLHDFENPIDAIENAQGIFTGGGNTFELVSKLHEQGLMKVIKETVENGIPYFGTSAGSNITGPTMKTTNDMPIVYPSSFDTLNLIRFNLNPHYLDPDPNSTHKGETRETRIKEFHQFNDTSVLGLREGSWLEVNGNKVVLKGKLSARLFVKNQQPKELETNSDLSYL